MTRKELRDNTFRLPGGGCFRLRQSRQVQHCFHCNKKIAVGELLLQVPREDRIGASATRWCLNCVWKFKLIAEGKKIIGEKVRA